MPELILPSDANNHNVNNSRQCVAEHVPCQPRVPGSFGYTLKAL